MAWNLELTEEVREWLHATRASDRATSRLVGQAIQTLIEIGPALGRPLVDRITGSTLQNMKELRPGSSGRSEIRILFAFDPRRNAVLLVAGDKAGEWNIWYEKAIPLTESLFTEWIERLEASPKEHER
ncbi:type II toxin-antitoxin system RelE/ParE family toxin [Streptosporangium sp. NBC_01755]|uniref:type II toxin-antitoxin system RelE/ParE family toxin n=1 Tax=unclassified Streptosporangium TaxID=2632669 RepID=UPI002DD94FFD|nr:MULTISPECIES: type II toxin-antitoxin system RelE/ParE family toxin [unclassified Streptosporangium]WSA27568.1 type II toxin-antitoxin system RelE/ParE family toxin [Streptosporangium sp. NBC_01810]WSD00961.1 type II toxin-antitoxin system RelE/ParE family toxin [Streptosporangium sp. NBC_01755]